MTWGQNVSLFAFYLITRRGPSATQVHTHVMYSYRATMLLGSKAATEKFSPLIHNLQRTAIKPAVNR